MSRRYRGRHRLSRRTRARLVGAALLGLVFGGL